MTVWRSLLGIKTWSPSVGDDVTLRIVAVAGAAAVELKAALLSKIPAGCAGRRRQRIQVTVVTIAKWHQPPASNGRFLGGMHGTPAALSRVAEHYFFMNIANASSTMLCAAGIWPFDVT